MRTANLFGATATSEAAMSFLAARRALRAMESKTGLSVSDVLSHAGCTRIADGLPVTASMLRGGYLYLFLASEHVPCNAKGGIQIADARAYGCRACRAIGGTIVTTYEVVKSKQDGYAIRLSTTKEALAGAFASACAIRSELAAKVIAG